MAIGRHVVTQLVPELTAGEIKQTAGLSLSDEEKPEAWGSIYREIGVTPVINATGSVTMLGGSTPHPEVQEAMDRANSAFVPLWELQNAISKSLSPMVGVPACMVTAGCGNALALSAGAAIAGDDPEAIKQLPNTRGLPRDEILIMRRQRYQFDRCLEASGAKLVDWGAETGPIDLKEMVAAITPRTCGVLYVANADVSKVYPYDYSKGPLPDFKELCEVAHAHNLSVIVDAAGQIYPLENLSRWVALGADASCVACKYMGASQSSGALLGTAAFVRKALLNSFTAYEFPGIHGDLSERQRARGFARPAKVDRQEMVGTWAALRRWTQTVNHDERKARVKAECEAMAAPLLGGAVPGVTVKVDTSEYGHQPYGVTVTIDPKAAGVDAKEIMGELKTTEPRVWMGAGRTPGSDPLDPSGGFTTLAMHPFALRPGELLVPAQRIAQIVKAKQPAQVR